MPNILVKNEEKPCSTCLLKTHGLISGSTRKSEFGYSIRSLVNILWLQVVCTYSRERRFYFLLLRLLKVIFGGFSGVVLSHRFSAMSSWNLFWREMSTRRTVEDQLYRGQNRGLFWFPPRQFDHEAVSSIADSGLKSLAAQIESQQITNCINLWPWWCSGVGINRYVCTFCCNILKIFTSTFQVTISFLNVFFYTGCVGFGITMGDYLTCFFSTLCKNMTFLS